MCFLSRFYNDAVYYKDAVFRSAAIALLLLATFAAPGALAVDKVGDDGDDGAVAADAADLSARDVLTKATDRVLAVIEEARGYVDEDPERYYAAVHEALDPIIDYRGFARGVMGEYASGARYRSLDEAGREVLREQLERFSETMRIGLVQTYSKGLLAFGGSRVEFADGSADDESERRATLRQLIYSDTSAPYVVVYQMAKNSDGKWQMRNLVVENVNLGQIYRSQFESAARRYDGDLDRVIDNWSTETSSSR